MPYRTRSVLLGATMGVWTVAAYAQPAPRPAAPAGAPAKDAGLEQIVVTGTARPAKKINTSISISTLSASRLQQLAPQSSADVLRNIPGIRSEASGGEGNANIAVRGLPVASGGGKFVQFQEDGLPVLLFGDIAFGTADTWIKYDYNIRDIEVVRGGAASTFASNAPGAVINFIDKTGTSQGGAIGFTSGLNYDSKRVDADYGGTLADGWHGHIGGYYHNGTGPRDLHYTAEDGGQVKANLTRDLENDGFLRLNVEYLNDKTPVYLPVPVRETGSGFSSLNGFDALTGTLNSNGLMHTLSLNHNGRVVNTDLSDGYHVVTAAVGGEVKYNLAGGWTLDDKLRYASNSGGFVGPYPALVDTAQNLADAIGGPGATLSYASGGKAGQVITNPGGLNGNGLGVNTVLFNVTIPNFNNFSNVLNVNKKIQTEGYGDINLTAGWFTMIQNLAMDWHWTDYLLDVNGSHPQLLDVTNAQGQKVTQGGTVAYYASGFGCASCTRFYNVQYDSNAPFFNLGYHYGPLNFDGSLRYDILKATGTYQAATGTFADNLAGPGGVPLQTANAALGPVQPTNYTKNAISYSFGANYLVVPNVGLFARVSRGNRFNADRALPALANGNVPTYQALNSVDQQEGGVKFQQPNFNVFATVFHATTQEYGTDITNTGLFVYQRSYESYGVETDAAAHYGPFAITGGVTWTHARITADPITPANIGQAPQRQAEWVYQFSPTYNLDAFTVGANIVGTSSSPAGQPSTVKMPAYTVVGMFAQYNVTERLRLQFNAENLFDAFAVTEVDQGNGALPADHLATARTYPGRTFEIGARYTF